MSKLFGCFVFRNEGNGCLTYIYLEHNGERPFTESCIQRAVTNSVDPFVGTFDTSWLEPGNQTDTLTITNSNDNLYNLVWSNISGNENFEYRGRGILIEGKLVGTYWGRTNRINI